MAYKAGAGESKGQQLCNTLSALRLLAGFTQSSNLHDVLMIKCPVAPPEDRDQLLQARLALLRSRGLTPQLFLPADLLEARPTRTSADRYNLLTCCVYMESQKDAPWIDYD